jgi:hypothetical protein
MTHIALRIPRFVEVEVEVNSTPLLDPLRVKILTLRDDIYFLFECMSSR